MRDVRNNIADWLQLCRRRMTSQIEDKLFRREIRLFTNMLQLSHLSPNFASRPAPAERRIF